MRHVAVVEVFHRGLDLGAGVFGAGALVLPQGRGLARDAGEAWNLGLVLPGLIARHPEGHAFGGEEDVERPAAGMAHEPGRALIEHVDIGPLVAVHQHGDEILIDEGRDLGIGEALAGHHMAPMAAGIAQAEQDGLVLGLGLGQGVGPPGAPLNGIVLVRKKIGAGGAVRGHRSGPN